MTIKPLGKRILARKIEEAEKKSAGGIVLPDTVKSEKVADFRIVSKSGGVSAPFNRPGWLGRIFDILWPF